MPAIGEDATALLAAQRSGDRWEEAVAFRRFHRNHIRASYNNGPRRNHLTRFYEKVGFGVTGCWFWLSTVDSGGYGVLNSRKAHRVSYELHNGPIPVGLKVLHRCDLPCCVNPNHLFLGTQADNVADMVAKRRQRGGGLSGEANAQSRLTWDVVHLARRLHADGHGNNALARRFGVSPMTMSRALRRESWNDADLT